MRKLVIIPTYNEKENISAMIDKVFSLPEPFEMLVIDDGSPDGTAAIVKERRKEFPERLHLMERAGKLGLGTAYLAGFRWGLENGFDYICEMDCDFSHNPDDLVRLYRAAAEGNERALLAEEKFAYEVKKYVGAYAAAMGGVDAIIFTAGVGENDKGIRAMVCDGLEYMGVKLDPAANDVRGKETVISAADSKVKVLLIPTNEELMIATDTAAIVKGN